MDTSPPAIPLCDPLARGRADSGGSPALVHKDITLTYDRVFEDVERIAEKLLDLGIKAGDRVAVHVRKPVTHWMVTLGLMRIGAVTLTLTSNAKNELAALPDVSTVICNAGEEDAFPETLWRFAVTRDWLDRPRPADGVLPPREVANRTVGRICFTSGTSGRPKAILLDAARLDARLARTAGRAGIGRGAALWCGLGPDTNFGFTATLATWLDGGTVFLSAGGPGAFERMHAHGVNILIASPAAFGPLIRDAQATDLPRLDCAAVAAGGRLSVDLRDQIRRHVCTDVQIAYGSSEAGGVTLGDAADLDIHRGRVGPIFDDVEVEVVDRSGAPLPPGSEGQLRIRTDSMASGYLNDDAASAQFFEGGWFHPGDIATVSETGDLTLLGRTTQILNLGGVKVPMEELENRLAALDGVEQACAFLMGRGPSEPELVIVVAAAPEAAKGLAAAVRAAFPRLPPFLAFSARDIPRGSMGKIRKQEVAEAVSAALEGAANGLGVVPLGRG